MLRVWSGGPAGIPNFLIVVVWGEEVTFTLLVEVFCLYAACLWVVCGVSARLFSALPCGITSVALTSFKHGRVSLTRGRVPNLVTLHRGCKRSGPLGNTHVVKSLRVAVRATILVRALITLNTRMH